MYRHHSPAVPHLFGGGISRWHLVAHPQEGITAAMGIRNQAPQPKRRRLRSGRRDRQWLRGGCVRLGEQTGRLPDMLQRASTQMRVQVQRRATALATVLEPLLIVAMGLVVMLIVLAVLLPIIEMNQLIR